MFSNLKKGKYQLFILGEEIFTFSGNSKNVNLENQLILSFEILDESSLNNVFTWGLNKKKIIPLDKNDLKFVAKTVAYNNILLSWDNSLVGKSDTLELQKSLNNVLFKTINKSSQINNGEYSDNSISPNTKYFYRIRIKKGDNFTNFSDTVSATSANVLGVEILENNTPSVYPNPLETFVNITNDNRTIDKIEIYSLIGKNIIVHDIISDEKVIKINLDKLVSGMYIVDIIDKKGNHIYKKIAKK